MRSRSRETWRKTLAPHLFEYKCLAELLKAVQDDALVFAKVLSVSSYILKHTIAAGSTVLHEQARQSQFYQQVTSRFIKIFESNQRQLSTAASSSLAVDTRESELVRDQEAVAMALSGLVLSGNENGKTHMDVATQKYFALANVNLPQASTRSSFNCDAFRVLADVLKYLHTPTPEEEQRIKKNPSDPSADVQSHYREQLECKYIERIGRILCHSRYDYVLAMVRTCTRTLCMCAGSTRGGVNRLLSLALRKCGCWRA